MPSPKNPMKSYQIIRAIWYYEDTNPMMLESDVFPNLYLAEDHYREVVDFEREDFEAMEGEILKETIKLISFDEESELVSNDPELYKTWIDHIEELESTELIYKEKITQ